jgi:hypothetical protein
MKGATMKIDSMELNSIGRDKSYDTQVEKKCEKDVDAVIGGQDQNATNNKYSAKEPVAGVEPIAELYSLSLY